MITLTLTSAGLFLSGHGTAAMVPARDSAALAAAIYQIIDRPLPILEEDAPAARPAWSKPLFAARDAEDRRRAQLAEARAQLGARLARARAAKY